MEYIEVAKFRLKSEVEELTFVNAEKEVREGMIKDEPGFLGRELCRDEEDNWLMVMRFKIKESMNKWLNDLKLDPTMEKMSQMIDFPSMRIEFFNKKI